MRRGERTDAQWERLERLLPPESPAPAGRGCGPGRLAGDNGHSSPAARRRLRRRGIYRVIPTRSDQRRQPDFDRAAYRPRNRVERLINRLKQARRVATRYKSAA